MKIVINKCYGGYGWISLKAAEMLIAKGWEVFNGFTEDGSRYKNENAKLLFWEGEYSLISKGSNDNRSRTDPDFIEVVETLGEEADGAYSEYAVVEIPDDVEWQIEEYDGLEWIAEKHRTWR